MAAATRHTVPVRGIRLGRAPTVAFLVMLLAGLTACGVVPSDPSNGDLAVRRVGETLTIWVPDCGARLVMGVSVYGLDDQGFLSKGGSDTPIWSGQVAAGTQRSVGPFGLDEAAFTAVDGRLQAGSRSLMVVAKTTEGEYQADVSPKTAADGVIDYQGRAISETAASNLRGCPGDN